MRKFAKISAVLAAMVLALAFAGCSDGGSSSDDVTVGGSSSGSETGGSSGGSGSSSSGNSSGSGSSSSEDSSTKNILAGKTYYSIDFEEKRFNSAADNRAKICISMCAFDSNGQKAKWTELAYDFKNGNVKKNETFGPDEFNYSVSGSTLTVGGDNDPLIGTINSDGTINAEGSVMKEFKGNLYAIAEAKADEKRLLAKAHIVIVNGAVCTYENRIFKSNANPQEDAEVVKGTVSGNTLTLGEGEETMTGSLSDESIIFIDPEDSSKQIFKRM